MPEQEECSDPSRALVIADDEALRLSLVFLLQMCGIEAAALVDVGELLSNSRLDEDFIFLDCTLSGCSGVSEIAELRRRGWQGAAVFMAEGEQWLAPHLLGGRTHVLVKPFAADDVLAIVGS